MSNNSCRKPFKADGSGGPSILDVMAALKQAGVPFEKSATKKELCSKLKKKGIAAVPSQLAFGEDAKICGLNKAPELHNRNFAEIYEMAREYNVKNPANAIAEIQRKNKIELCNELIAKGQEVSLPRPVGFVMPALDKVSLHNQRVMSRQQDALSRKAQHDLMKAQEAQEKMLKKQEADQKNMMRKMQLGQVKECAATYRPELNNLKREELDRLVEAYNKSGIPEERKIHRSKSLDKKKLCKVMLDRGIQVVRVPTGNMEGAAIVNAENALANANRVLFSETLDNKLAQREANREVQRENAAAAAVLNSAPLLVAQEPIIQRGLFDSVPSLAPSAPAARPLRSNLDLSAVPIQDIMSGNQGANSGLVPVPEPNLGSRRRSSRRRHSRSRSRSRSPSRRSRVNHMPKSKRSCSKRHMNWVRVKGRKSHCRRKNLKL